MRRRTVLSTLAFVLIAACAPANGAGKPDSATAAADLQGIGKERDAFAAAFKAGDVAAVTALYTSDGLTQPNFAATGTGASGLAAAYKGFFDQFNGITSFVLTPVKTEVSGNLAYDIGTYTFTAAPKTKGDAIKGDGRYIVVMRKGADGTWKTIADMDNLTAPPAPPPPAAKGKAK
jgi:ketosteroid isomerase-like protein